MAGCWGLLAGGGACRRARPAPLLPHLVPPPAPLPCPLPSLAQVIAKCETRQSLFNFRALVDASDAIIISRGNLGLDVVRGRVGGGGGGAGATWGLRGGWG